MRNPFSLPPALVLSAVLLLGCQPRFHPTANLQTGVAQDLARYRKRVLDSIYYQLELQVPPEKNEPIKGIQNIRFRLSGTRLSLPLDFRADSTQLLGCEVNGKEARVLLEKEHIVLPGRLLRNSINTVRLRFIAGDQSLNRNESYLYTLLVPDRARTAFPVFDQPDLKARWQLTLTLPAGWKALFNAPLLDSAHAAGSSTWRFGQSDLIPSYLFAFTAGRFKEIRDTANGRYMRFLHRETDSSKLRLSKAPVFRLHGEALRYLENYTGIPYPFLKFDFAAIPDFQYGGMEHPGAISYKASTLFLDAGATRDEELNRANLIAHETAHMWFGDLVTMRWFDDVWTKEVFANFMADKVTQAAMPSSSYGLKFLLAHHPAAYSVDRSAGANPIRQPLANLQEAGTLYGNIIYHKAPIVMRQLERMMGADVFRTGIQEYLRRYALGNASWPELIDILDRHTPLDLKAWNSIWVDEAGRPVFDFETTREGDRLRIRETRHRGEDSSLRRWPQQFTVGLVYADTVMQELMRAGTDTEIRQSEGRGRPEYLVFNADGMGYGLFPTDPAMLGSAVFPADPVVRASAFINLYENMLSGRTITARQTLEYFLTAACLESEDLILRYLTSQISDIYWRLLAANDRMARAPGLERRLWKALLQAPTAGRKKQFFRLYQSLAQTSEALDQLYQIWKQQQAPAGIVLTEDDYTGLALSLALRDHADRNILSLQQERISNPDRKARLAFLAPALSSATAVRDSFFLSLRQESNREKEAWVTAALGYLHHPLRAPESIRYLQTSLELLEEIQRTGDIFFPSSWLPATLGSYQSTEAAAIVRRFLEERPNFSPRLKAKVLQAADPLFRAVRLCTANHAGEVR